MTLKVKLAAILFAGALALPANASTITFDNNGGPGYTESGFTFDSARIVSGNCNSGSCMALNKNETSTLTSSKADTPLFSLTSFWFQLLGGKAELTVTSSKGGSLVLTVANYGHNDGGHTYNLADHALFDNIAWLKFDGTGKGNLRVDDVTTVAAVPIPAAGLLLLGGLGGLVALRRPRKAA